MKSDSCVLDMSTDFKTSMQLFTRAERVIPGGICSDVRAKAPPFPLYYERAAGCHIWDVDGNEYIDYVLGQGPMLLGYSPRPVIEAIQKQAAKGLVYAGQTELEVRVAELICRLVPSAEMVRISSTGSEAVHAALRLARAVTGRKKVLRFEGHYHGWFDTIAWNHAAPAAELGPPDEPTPRPSSRGQLPEDGNNLLVLPWNRLDLVESLFRKRGSEIAAIITEPVMCNWGAIPPQPGFLEGLRDVCDRFETLLIFDEVITGFRVALGGAQALFGVTPDLATFAKAMGGGAVASAVAGKAEYMEALGAPETVHAGTYNSNPVSMAGTLAALEMLSADNGAELEKAHAACRHLMEGIRILAKKSSPDLHVRGVPPVMHVSFVPAGADPITDFRSSLQTDMQRTRELGARLHERGIRITERGVWFVSTVHSEQDVEQTLAVLAEVLEGC